MAQFVQLVVMLMTEEIMQESLFLECVCVLKHICMLAYSGALLCDWNMHSKKYFFKHINPKLTSGFPMPT